jgi:cytochrome P450 family 4
MFAGHDTTTTTLSFLFYELARNPDIQQRVCDEIREVFSTEGTLHIEGTKDLNRLRYLDLVIKEILRMYPSVVFIARKVTSDFDFDGYFLKKGETLAINIIAMHYDEKYFPEPEKFWPERFADQEVGPTKIHPFAYIPFSAGYRNCIGQKFALNEIKMTAINILFHFHLRLKDENYKLVLAPEGVLRTAEPIELIFEERH